MQIWPEGKNSFLIYKAGDSLEKHLGNIGLLYNTAAITSHSYWKQEALQNAVLCVNKYAVKGQVKGQSFNLAVDVGPNDVAWVKGGLVGPWTLLPEESACCLTLLKHRFCNPDPMPPPAGSTPRAIDC